VVCGAGFHINMRGQGSRAQRSSPQTGLTLDFRAKRGWFRAKRALIPRAKREIMPPVPREARSDLHIRAKQALDSRGISPYIFRYKVRLEISHEERFDFG
jgi:hypothetical protein